MPKITQPGFKPRQPAWEQSHLTATGQLNRNLGFPTSRNTLWLHGPPSTTHPGHVVPNNSRKEAECRGRGQCAFLQNSLIMALVWLCPQRDGSEGPEDEAVEPGCGCSEGTGPSSPQGQKWEREGTQPELKGLQNPSDLRSTPGPYQAPAWGSGRKERAECEDVGTWEPMVGTLRLPYRPGMDIPSSECGPCDLPSLARPKATQSPRDWPEVVDLGGRKYHTLPACLCGQWGW